MKTYVVVAAGSTFSATPFAVSPLLKKAMALAEDAALAIDNDGYHNIYVYELDTDTLMLTKSDDVYSGSNGTPTARLVSTLERCRDCLTGTWRNV
jgi:hypothetical protein